MDAQLIPVPVGSVNYVAGGSATLNFDRALAQAGGRIPHIRKLTFHTRGTPTLSSGTMTPEEAQQIVTGLNIRDSVRTLYQGDFRRLRLQEALEKGRLGAPEPDGAATTEQVNYVREYDLAIPSFLDSSDFLKPLAAFKSGAIEFTFGALLDIDANCTGMVATIDVIAWVTVLDDVIIGCEVERKLQPLTSGTAHSTEALYAFIALLKNPAAAAFAAGELVNLRVKSEAFYTEAIDTRSLLQAYYLDMDAGPLSQVQGEPRAATDDNAKVVAGTALAAATANLQPVVWSPRGSRISKLLHQARPDIVVEVGGSLNAPLGMFTRIIPRTTEMMGKYVGAINAVLPIDLNQWQMKTRAYTKGRPYAGNRGAYMPVKYDPPTKAQPGRV